MSLSLTLPVSQNPAFVLPTEGNELKITIGSSENSSLPNDQIHLLFSSSPEAPEDLGLEAKVSDYVKQWQDSFKSDKYFFNHLIMPLIASEGIKNEEKLAHSRAVEIGQKIALLAKEMFLFSRLQKSPEIHEAIREIEVAKDRFAAIQGALKAIHQHHSLAYVDERNGNHRCREINEKTLLTYQLLSHRLAYNIHDEETVEIPVPVNERYLLTAYKIHKIHYCLNAHAFGLTPVSNPEAPPLLLFPGTRTNLLKDGAGEALVADFDPFGPGHTFFKWGQSYLEEWLKLNTDAAANRKAIVMGHSLGGALATHTATYLSPYVKEAFACNSPGVGPLTANEYDRLEKEGLASPIYNFNSFPDIIPSLGHQRVGIDFAVLPNLSGVVQSSIAHHKETTLEHSSFIFEYKVKMLIPSLIYTLVLPIFFALGLVYLALRTLIFGHANSKHFTYLLSPLYLLAELITACAKSLFSDHEVHPVPISATV